MRKNDNAINDNPIDNIPSDEFDSIAQSQFNIAKTILANPDAIVLDEGLIKDLSEKDFTYEKFSGEKFNKTIVDQIKKDFPKGFPANYADLTKRQQNWLVSRGSAHVLFSLGLLKNIYKTDTPEEAKTMIENLREKKFFNPSFFGHVKRIFLNPITDDPEIKKIIIDRREQFAINLAEEAALKTGKNLILLIYGQAHKMGERMKAMNRSNLIYEGRVVTSADGKKFLSPDEKTIPCATQIAVTQAKPASIKMLSRRHSRR